jgi:hypothetical protein
VLLELRHFSFSQHAPWALAVKELQQSLARALAASHSASHSAIVLPDENPVCAPDVPVPSGSASLPAVGFSRVYVLACTVAEQRISRPAATASWALLAAIMVAVSQLAADDGVPDDASGGLTNYSCTSTWPIPSPPSIDRFGCGGRRDCITHVFLAEFTTDLVSFARCLASR